MDGAITTLMLRKVIRSRIAAGVSQQSISALIHAFAAPSASNRGGRIAIEHIANADRGTFLDELGKLRSGTRPAIAVLTLPPPAHTIPAGIPLARRLHVR
jgi:hypothetical protein